MNEGKYSIGTFTLEGSTILTALVYAFPLYLLAVLSFKTPNEVAQSPLSPPDSLYLANYQEAWVSASLGSALLNSVTVTGLSVLTLVIVGSLGAYSIARLPGRVSNALYLLFVLGIILPFQLGLIPLYQMMRDADLIGTYTSLILFYGGWQLPATVFLYTGFIRALPVDYEQAAMVDGATQLQAFRKIVFPLLRPITGTVIVLNGILIWNDFLAPVLYVGGTTQATVPIAVFSFVGQYGAQWGLVFAGLVISILPMLLIYFMLQRYLIRGFTSGVKG